MNGFESTTTEPDEIPQTITKEFEALIEFDANDLEDRDLTILSRFELYGWFYEYIPQHERTLAPAVRLVKYFNTAGLAIKESSTITESLLYDVVLHRVVEVVYEVRNELQSFIDKVAH